MNQVILIDYKLITPRIEKDCVDWSGIEIRPNSFLLLF